ncbi:MAG TPA: 16S rRNA (adenine(1518)-N(6)/adenine(1519)-N(6))-dimethyltransferase RsmA [Candidatus Hydrogenedentes bacterium]|nr:16S rRNA (adenine(1518)-N(6)/adenine(1519)-N(6))-dimethyltransferase RsmA [Candidatus Hydrogenedentota bacterium]HPG65865.1 16S rRNA (adenine(1518)-N(6)/adenine(1519)-N(6))-dimethyltransferase RsmA [Candidatus Hydrogenedentota bacterium]
MSTHLKDLVAQYGIQFKKGLGQNLLLDDNINRIMVEAAALTSDDAVVEVGAGLGALTERLCRQAGRVLAVEIDRSFMPCLEDQFGDMEHVRLFRGDVLNHEVGKLIEEFIPGAASYKMISNLPYYITTPVLFHFLESSVRFSRMVVMVQEEVGLRMTASVGSREYGVLALAMEFYAEVDMVHKVPRTCFAPRPEVDSCIVRLRMRSEPLYGDVESGFLFQVVRTAFSQRRKTLRNALTRSGALGLDAAAVDEALGEAGIEAARRPQTLSLAEFAALARRLAHQRRSRCDDKRDRLQRGDGG